MLTSSEETSMQLQSNIGEEATSKRKKKGSGSDSRANPQMYLLLENLVWRYRRPCVLDLKVYARSNFTLVTEASYFISNYSKFICLKLVRGKILRTYFMDGP